jgi:hypothetical protein
MNTIHHNVCNVAFFSFFSQSDNDGNGVRSNKAKKKHCMKKEQIVSMRKKRK